MHSVGRFVSLSGEFLKPLLDHSQPFDIITSVLHLYELLSLLLRGHCRLEQVFSSSCPHLNLQKTSKLLIFFSL